MSCSNTAARSDRGLLAGLRRAARGAARAAVESLRSVRTVLQRTTRGQKTHLAARPRLLRCSGHLFCLTDFCFVIEVSSFFSGILSGKYKEAVSRVVVPGSVAAAVQRQRRVVVQRAAAANWRRKAGVVAHAQVVVTGQSASAGSRTTRGK